MLTYTSFLFSKSTMISYSIFVLSFGFAVLSKKGWTIRNIIKYLSLSAMFSLLPCMIASEVMFKDYKHANEVCQEHSSQGYKMEGALCYRPYSGYVVYNTDELPEDN